jgi:alkylation response protein AidB-like acyl-CoA dehydrogenase
MKDWNSVSDDAFRLAFRQWLTDNYPPEWRQDAVRPFRRLSGGDKVRWLRMLHDAGWRAPSWPREHGGMGLSFSKQLIYVQELELQRASRIVDFGEQMLGPIVMTFGSAAQKAHILPRILNCEEVWCQGYSEPNAGSDLASLRTAASLEGDEFVVNGQKIWTTYAQDATHVFALVRTGQFPRKQQGISFLLIDLTSAGVQIRPIMNIAGEQEFCEVFFSDVRVPVQNLLGTLNEGWTIAKTLLGHERIWVGSPGMCRAALALARQLIETLGLSHDTRTVDQLTELAVDLHDYEALYDEICTDAAARGEIGPHVAMLKVLATELQQRICEFVSALSQECSGVVGTTQIGDLEIDVHWTLMMSRPITIFGGANEVQRDILAKAVLGLPAAR